MATLTLPNGWLSSMSRTATVRAASAPSGKAETSSRDRVVSRENGKAEPSETDAQLVALVRDGDQRAFERLVRRHLREAHVVAASKLGGDSDDADDVVQESFITAL